MAAKIVQCVPNFSEGKRGDVVRAIVSAMTAASRAKVADYSMDPDHNRAVVTILGELEDVKEALLAGAGKGVELIDIRKHKGEHPRIGAVDVIPIIPVLGCTMAECIALSYDLGKELAERYALPVYFYERSAHMSHRTNLADIRKGGFEGLKATGLVGDKEPDLGPRELHPSAGATVVGARGPLIAYNINLRTKDVSVARKIAKKIRKLREEGEAMIGVKAMGVNLRSRGMTQVSMNITQPHVVSLYEVFTFVESEARRLGAEVVESELVGIMREEAVIDVLCDAIKIPNLNESRILDNWLPRRSFE